MALDNEQEFISYSNFIENGLRSNNPKNGYIFRYAYGERFLTDSRYKFFRNKRNNFDSTMLDDKRNRLQWVLNKDITIDNQLKILLKENYKTQLPERKFKSAQITVSLLSNNSTYLFTLLEEVNRDVFINKGKVLDTVSPWELVAKGNRTSDVFTYSLETPFYPSTNNIILFCPDNSDKPQPNSYIGVFDNGEYEIRIIAQRIITSSRIELVYWDTDIEKIVDSLQLAINWWEEIFAKNKIDYSNYPDDYDPNEPPDDSDPSGDAYGDFIGNDGEWVSWDGE